MINVKIRRDEEGYIYGYSVEGHTENGNEVDEAVACNSVSVVTQFPLIGAQRQLKLNAEIAVDKEIGWLWVDFPSYANLRLQAMLETMVICLKMLQEKGVEINLKEV